MPINHRYKRTVRCGYCHETGHNKASCPKYAARIEELREAYGDNYYAVADYDRKKAKRKASGKTRKCSYCHEVGHNRKTCPTLKEHMAITRARNVEYRKEIFKAMVQHGIFTGAILESDNHRGHGESGTWRKPMVITRVMWSDINIWETEFRYYSVDIRERAPFKAKPLCALHTPYEVDLGFPLDYELLWNRLTTDQFTAYAGDGDNGWYGRFKDTYFTTVISRVNAEKPPLGWLTCEDAETEKALKEFYKKRMWTEPYVGLSKDMDLLDLQRLKRDNGIKAV